MGSNVAALVENASCTSACCWSVAREAHLGESTRWMSLDELSSDPSSMVESPPSSWKDSSARRPPRHRRHNPA
eukprot:9489107-Pyramimonas_sp.AAC.1